jgi:hypothetical protein
MGHFFDRKIKMKRSKKMQTKVVVRDEFDGIPYTYLENGRCVVTGETEESFKEGGFLVLTADEFNEFYEKWAEKKSADWTEITEEQYDYFLNVLPPVKFDRGGFFVSEMNCYDLGTFIQKFGTRYFKSEQRITTSRKKIIASLTKWLREESAPCRI